MTVNKLRALLRESGLTVSGKKADLIKRLKYSARAKKALISPHHGSDDEKISIANSEKKSPTVNEGSEYICNSSTKTLRKRPISRNEGNLTSSKKAKLGQETISSLLRKRSPIASTSRTTDTVSSTSTFKRKSPKSNVSVVSINSNKKTSPSQRTTIISTTKATSTVLSASTFKRKSPISTDSVSSVHRDKKTSPSQIDTRESKRLSPPLSSSKNGREGPSSLRKSKRMTTREKALRESSRLISSNGVGSEATADMKENIGSLPKRLNKRRTKTHTLSTITNSAKKRKSKRRASMASSMNKALLQIEQLEQMPLFGNQS